MGANFAWSYSRLKNFETCPKRHYEVDIAKNFREEEKEGSALDWGNRVHKALARALEGVSLPPEMIAYQKWVDRVKLGGSPGSKLLVEQRFAITRAFAKTEWFGPEVWFRTVGDVVRIDPPVALVLDWKTGKLLMDSVQLMLTAQCIFVFYPEVQKVRSEFVWLKDDCSTPEIYSRPDMATSWVGLLDRVAQMEQAANTLTYPPKPGRLCKRWCPVASCPYHGKGA